MASIDIHTHAFPDELAGRAMAALQAAADWKAAGDGTIAGLIRSMDAADVDVSVVCTIATKPDQVEGIFQWCKKVRSSRIEPLPSVHPATPKAAKWIEKFAKARFVGIKLHPMYQEFEFDDRRMDEIYAAAAGCGLLITAHCGRDIAFPPEDDRASPQRIRRVMDRLPKLRLLCTHLGGWRDWDAAEELLVGTNCFMETSLTVRHAGAQRVRQIISRHGADRVLFGTDWPWSGQKDDIRRIRSLGLGRDQARAVLFANAARLLGL